MHIEFTKKQAYPLHHLRIHIPSSSSFHVVAERRKGVPTCSAPKRSCKTRFVHLGHHTGEISKPHGQAGDVGMSKG